MADTIVLAEQRYEDEFPEAAEELKTICHEQEYRRSVLPFLPEFGGVGSSIPKGLRWRDSREVAASTAPGRNAPCPCGSGRKYKKCCARKERA